MQPPRPPMLQHPQTIFLLGGKGETWAAVLTGRSQSGQEALQRSLTANIADCLVSDHGVGQWAFGCRRLLPRQAPPATLTIAGPCFLQDNMHGDSYPCCRQSIRLCLPAYSSKALTDVEIAAKLP
jgi:hypothetical protein